MALQDKEILENIAKGRDHEALSAIYKNSLPKIRKYVISNNGTEDDAKDIFQDTIVIFYKQVKTGKFREGGNIDSFLYSVARNLYINYVTRYVNRNLKTEIRENLDSSEDILQQLISQEKERLVDKLFNQLGSRCSEILKLSLFNEFSMKDIAIKMGFSNENVAKSKSYKCRLRLSELVKNNKELINIFRP